MNSLQELIDKMLLYFNAEKVNVEVIEGARTYIQKLNLGSVEFTLFYEAMKENHESKVFPAVWQIKKLWNEHGVRYNETRSTKDVDTARETYRRTGHGEVVRLIKVIKEKHSREEELSNKEIDLMNTYDDLVYVYNQVNALPDEVMNRDCKEVYIRKAKETIDSGNDIIFTIFNREMDKRRAQAVEMFGEQDEEIDSMLSTSVENMQYAFKARKEEVQLSDYEKEAARQGLR